MADGSRQLRFETSNPAFFSLLSCTASSTGVYSGLGDPLASLGSTSCRKTWKLTVSSGMCFRKRAKCRLHPSPLTNPLPSRLQSRLRFVFIGSGLELRAPTGSFAPWYWAVMPDHLTGECPSQRGELSALAPLDWFGRPFGTTSPHGETVCRTSTVSKSTSGGLGRVEKRCRSHVLSEWLSRLVLFWLPLPLVRGVAGL